MTCRPTSKAPCWGNNRKHEKSHHKHSVTMGDNKSHHKDSETMWVTRNRITSTWEQWGTRQIASQALENNGKHFDFRVTKIFSKNACKQDFFDFLLDLFGFVSLSFGFFLDVFGLLWICFQRKVKEISKQVQTNPNESKQSRRKVNANRIASLPMTLMKSTVFYGELVGPASRSEIALVEKRVRLGVKDAPIACGWAEASSCF